MDGTTAQDAAAWSTAAESPGRMPLSGAPYTGIKKNLNSEKKKTMRSRSFKINNNHTVKLFSLLCLNLFTFYPYCLLSNFFCILNIKGSGACSPLTLPLVLCY